MKSAFIASCLKKPIWKLIKRKQINFRMIAKKTAEKLIDGLERLSLCHFLKQKQQNLWCVLQH